MSDIFWYTRIREEDVKIEVEKYEWPSQEIRDELRFVLEGEGEVPDKIDQKWVEENVPLARIRDLSERLHQRYGRLPNRSKLVHGHKEVWFDACSFFENKLLGRNK
tara:strand:+ start:310 stop:627 length:318 start_codon:yes stop_codon:yes gene_type:complete